MPTALRLVLLALVILGGSMWIGGMAAVTIVSRASRSVLAPADRVALFKAFGPRYFGTAGVALLVSAGCGLVLLIERGWDGLATAIVVILAALIAALGVGVRQARGMRRLRTAAQDHPEDEAAASAARSAARWAALTRALLGALSIAVFVLAICTAA
ncbi:MAG: hypothetical protein BGO26_14855 [Actinobacteria bacterium 69-20]|nr:hypothetical protein [Actinomycetota bacterium]OJV29581.1 MAG: hypothetical protein BGO26_14855 [Actinobacteria bacterium 69-20]